MSREHEVGPFDAHSGPYSWFIASQVATQGMNAHPAYDQLLRPQTTMLPGLGKFLDYGLQRPQI